MEPYIGMIVPAAFNFEPRGWAFCDGRLLAIQENTALFALLGTRFGGDGRVTFGLPDLRGRSPRGAAGLAPGRATGSASVTLTPAQMPAHRHALNASQAAVGRSGGTPADRLIAVSETPQDGIRYSPPATTVTLSDANIGTAGESQPHDNMQPYIAVNYLIALTGLFPSRS